MKASEWGMLGAGIALGAVAAALIDPRRGAARRAIFRDKGLSVARHARKTLERRGRDLRQRMKGVVWEAMHADEEVPDDILAERVRAQLGRPLSHPRLVDLRAENGRIILLGAVLADEVDSLLARVAHVRGVKQIDSQLDVCEHEGELERHAGARWRVSALTPQH